jgi:hypothetical protein
VGAGKKPLSLQKEAGVQHRLIKPLLTLRFMSCVVFSSPPRTVCSLRGTGYCFPFLKIIAAVMPVVAIVIMAVVSDVSGMVGDGVGGVDEAVGGGLMVP